MSDPKRFSVVVSKGLSTLIKTASKLALGEFSQIDARGPGRVSWAYCSRMAEGCIASSGRRRTGREYLRSITL